MEKLKAAKYKIAGVIVSSRGDDGGLDRLRNSSNNDDESKAFNTPSLSLVSIILHSLAIFFTFLAICTMAAVAAFQGKWFGVSGGSAFTLFLLLLDFILLCCLLGIPLIYDRWDKGHRAAQFLSQARAAFILHVFGTGIMLIAAFIVTISAWTAKGCKNPDDDPHEDLGDDFKNGLKGWCRTKKASAIMDWLAVAAWIGLLVLSGLAFREDRRNHREPAFIPPSSPGGAETGMSASQRPYAQVGDSADDDVFADKYEAGAPPVQPAPYGYGRPNVLAQQDASSAMARPSVDAYGAFDGDMPGARVPVPGYEPSRTMQMAAYSDPYADVRAQVLSDGGFGHPTPPPQQMAYPTPAPGQPAHYHPGY